MALSKTQVQRVTDRSGVERVSFCQKHILFERGCSTWWLFRFSGVVHKSFYLIILLNYLLVRSDVEWACGELTSENVDCTARPTPVVRVVHQQYVHSASTTKAAITCAARDCHVELNDCPANRQSLVRRCHDSLPLQPGFATMDSPTSQMYCGDLATSQRESVAWLDAQLSLFRGLRCFLAVCPSVARTDTKYVAICPYTSDQWQVSDHLTPLSSRMLNKKLSYRRNSTRRRSLGRLRLFKVTDVCTKRKPVCDFLLANNTYVIASLTVF